MVRLGIMAGISVAAISAAAFAETDANLARQWGLLGTWSTDCSRPPTENDPYLIYQAAGDKVLHRRDYPKLAESNPNYPKDTDASPIRSVELVDGGGIKLEIYLPDFDPPQTRVYELYRDGDKMHTKYNYRVSDGSYSIKDFVIVANGQPAVWIYKCQ